MKNFIIACIAAVVAADTIILPAPASAQGEQVAVVWIHGMQCPQEQYTSIALAVQNAGVAQKQAIWVGIPEFLFDAPEPILIDHYIEETISQLKKAGFKGQTVLLAAHSLGGVMSQKYAKDHTDTIKGQILMGSVLTRDNHTLNADGTTHFNYPVPTLTLGGTKDGLMRITRMAEAYYHQIDNIESAQKGMFPVFALEGASHMSFMSGVPPGLVMKKDLRPEISEADAHKAFATKITSFINQVTTGSFAGFEETSTQKILSPLLEAMHLEGSYALKPPCYDTELINRKSDPTCAHGSPWNAKYTQMIMGGDFGNPFINVNNDDNFHRVQSIAPVHLPEIDTTCDISVKETCFLNTVTVSECHYDFLDKFDTGYYPISASEIKTKISSRQAVQQKAGNAKADFHEMDEVGNRCAEINNEAINWAYKHLSPSAKARYDQFGTKLVTGDDNGPYNEGPLWIWTMMDYKESSDHTTLTAKSAMMRTPTDYFISAAAGFHYCKVLSPFRAIEHMYVDSLFHFDGIYLDYQKSAELFLQ